MLNGHYEFDKEEDVNAYIAEVLQPALDNAELPLAYVKIPVTRYEVFPILKNEANNYEALTIEQKRDLQARANNWFAQAQLGIDSISSLNIKTYLKVTEIDSLYYRLQITFSGLTDQVVERVEWSFEKSIGSGDFENYFVNCIPSEVKAADPHNIEEADVVLSSGNWLKYKWIEDDGDGAQEYTGAIHDLAFRFAGVQGDEAAQLLIKARVIFSNRAEVYAFGFMQIPAKISE